MEVEQSGVRAKTEARWLARHPHSWFRGLENSHRASFCEYTNPTLESCRVEAWRTSLGLAMRTKVEALNPTLDSMSSRESSAVNLRAMRCRRSCWTVFGRCRSRRLGVIGFLCLVPSSISLALVHEEFLREDGVHELSDGSAQRQAALQLKGRHLSSSTSTRTMSGPGRRRERNASSHLALAAMPAACSRITTGIGVSVGIRTSSESVAVWLFDVESGVGSESGRAARPRPGVLRAELSSDSSTNRTCTGTRPMIIMQQHIAHIQSFGSDSTPGVDQALINSNTSRTADAPASCARRTLSLGSPPAVPIKTMVPREVERGPSAIHGSAMLRGAWTLGRRPTRKANDSRKGNDNGYSTAMHGSKSNSIARRTHSRLGSLCRQSGVFQGCK